MNKITLKVIDQNNNIKAAKSDFTCVSFTYRGEYKEGDKIIIESEQTPRYLIIRLEDSLESALIYMTSPKMVFTIPFSEQSRVYSDKSFRGGKHFLWAREARDYEIYNYQNLAYNPYLQLNQTGIFPSVSSDMVATNIRFAARNTIDGCFDTSEHGSYPFTSWSNSQKQDAQLNFNFGREVNVDACIFYLRADFPHDSWWQEATLIFLGSETEEIETFNLTRTGAPQFFSFPTKCCEKITLTHLVKGDEPAIFTALSQIEILGSTVRK